MAHSSLFAPSTAWAKKKPGPHGRGGGEIVSLGPNRRKRQALSFGKGEVRTFFRTEGRGGKKKSGSKHFSLL